MLKASGPIIIVGIWTCQRNRSMPVAPPRKKGRNAKHTTKKDNRLTVRLSTGFASPIISKDEIRHVTRINSLTKFHSEQSLNFIDWLYESCWLSRVVITSLKIHRNFRTARFIQQVLIFCFTKQFIFNATKLISKLTNKTIHMFIIQ